MAYENLFAEGTIGNLKVRNRSVMVGMELGTARFDGSAGDRTRGYFEERAKGGVGLIITGICRVNGRSGIGGPAQLAMTHDRHIKPLSELAEAVHRHGTKLVIQLHHPGRQTLGLIATGWPIAEAIGNLLGDNRAGELFYKTLFRIVSLFSVSDLDRPIVKFLTSKVLPPVLSASAIPCSLGRSQIHDTKTRALTEKEIGQLVREFGEAAARVKAAGADGVEIHAGHGYLIEQFLSPHTNRRTDRYGGSLENRMRFLTEIYQEIRRKVGDDFAVTCRLGVDENYAAIGLPGTGIEIDEGVEMAKRLEEMGIDAISVTRGTYETANFSIEPASYPAGTRTGIIRAVKDAVKVPIIAVNLIRTPGEAEAYLEEGLMDFVGLGRPLLADPAFMNKAAEERAEDIQRCICCLWCIESLVLNQLKGEPAECALNPRTCREIESPAELPRDGRDRVVVVVGGGVAGLMAANTTARRGFRTILFERNPELGGQLYLATKPPHKEKLGWAIEDLAAAARRNGVDIHLDTAPTAERIRELAPCAVIDATGGESLSPMIKGADKPHVSTVTPVLEGKTVLSGKKVAVIGSGMTGLETAEMIAEQGNDVVVVEMAKTVAPGTWGQHLQDILPRLEKLGVKIVTGRRLVEVTDNSIIVESPWGRKQERLAADNVVLSVGVCSNSIPVDVLPPSAKTIKVGDACSPGRIANATHTAYRAALTI